MARAFLQSAFRVLQRHGFVARGLLVVAGLLASGGAIVTVWHTTMAKVVFGLFVVFAGMLTLVMLIAGAAMQLKRLRETRAG